MKKTSSFKNQDGINNDEKDAESIKDINLGEELDSSAAGAKVVASEVRLSADNTIKNHVIAGMTIGLVPVPLFDWGLLVTSQVKMVHSLCKLYEVPFAENKTKSIIASLIGGSIPVFSTIGLSAGAKLIPGIGTLLGSGIVSTAGGATTYAVGQVFSKHFESGGTLLNIDSEKLRNMFKKELSKGKKVAKEFDADSQVAANAKAS